jgi:hypothetical protein
MNTHSNGQLRAVADPCGESQAQFNCQAAIWKRSDSIVFERSIDSSAFISR